MPKRIDEEKLFLEVVRILVDRGFDKATTKQIAEAAGINEVTLFRKFGSKEGLIRTALQHILADSPLHNLTYTGDLKSDLITIVQAYNEMSTQYGEVIATLVTEIPRDPAYQELLTPFFEVVRSITEIILLYQEQKVLKEEPGFSVVSALLGPIMVRKMLEKTRPGFTMGEFSADEYVTDFLGGRGK